MLGHNDAEQIRIEFIPTTTDWDDVWASGKGVLSITIADGSPNDFEAGDEFEVQVINNNGTITFGDVVTICGDADGTITVANVRGDWPSEKLRIKCVSGGSSDARFEVRGYTTGLCKVMLAGLETDPADATYPDKVISSGSAYYAIYDGIKTGDPILKSVFHDISTYMPVANTTTTIYNGYGFKVAHASGVDNDPREVVYQHRSGG